MGLGLIHRFGDGGGCGECDGQQQMRRCGGVVLMMIYGGDGDWHRIGFDGTSALYIILVF